MAKEDWRGDAVDGVRVCGGVGEELGRDAHDTICYQWRSSNGLDHLGSKVYFRIWMIYKTLEPDGTERIVNTTFERLTSDEVNKLIKAKNPSWGKYGYHTHETFLELPYWSVVLPLTLISAWLMLSKPYKSIPTKTREPTSNVGA